MTDELDHKLAQILENTLIRVRNKAIADVYHYFKGKKITGADLARLFKMTPQQISNLENRYYPKPK